ncbi:MAG: baseplate J/gp47 family protein, partial [Lachnospiraceae bacterium]|nr:baseplate J/gp47 family protein [Lachnospiraceae bacterium]
MMDEADDGIASLTNPEPTEGGKEEESDDDLYDRMVLEYVNSNTYLGNDSDYERWAKEAGAGDCIVIPAADGPGTVKLVLIDTDGQPADENLVQNVYNHIVSPDNRSKRLLPTACASLSCVAAETKAINYKCTGLLFDGTVDLEQIKDDFAQAVKQLYKDAKKEGVLRYNDVRPLISDISGVEDFQDFLINGAMENIAFIKEEYPQTGTVDFS